MKNRASNHPSLQDTLQSMKTIKNRSKSMKIQASEHRINSKPRRSTQTRTNERPGARGYGKTSYSIKGLQGRCHPQQRGTPEQSGRPKRKSRTTQKCRTMQRPRTPVEKDALFGISQTAKAPAPSGAEKEAQQRKSYAEQGTSLALVRL